MTRHRTLLAAALLIATALPGHAQSSFERLEAVAVQMNALMNEALVADIPALAGNLPDPAWDEPMRAAYRCMYDGYVDLSSEAAVAAMVDQMEAQLVDIDPAVFLEGGIQPDNPDGISDEQAVQIVEECGVMAQFFDRMVASGAMGIMMQQ